MVPIDKITVTEETLGTLREESVNSHCRALQKTGQRIPILVRHDGTLVIGRNQLEAAKRLDWKQIQVIVEKEV